MVLNKKHLQSLIFDKIEFEKRSVSFATEKEREMFIGGMRLCLDIIQDTENYEDESFSEELLDSDMEEIASSIRSGCTSGILDSERYRTSWQLLANKFRTN